MVIKMKILGIDSSGLVASVAVVEDDVLLAEYTTNYKKTHSQTLLPMLDEISKMIDLDMSSLDAIAIAAGPGSFTGLRIGAATAKGLGLALDKPLVEVKTLEGLAYNMYGSRQLICPMMDARRNQVYTGLYEFRQNEHGFQLYTIMEQCALDIQEIVAKVNALEREVIFLGDGVPVYRDAIMEKTRVNYEFASPGHAYQRASSIAVLGQEYFKQGRTVPAAMHQPIYLRKSQAEREREEKTEKPIIRKLHSQDIPALCKIQEEAFSLPWSEKDYCDLLKHDYCTYLVAELAGKVVGCCGMTNSCEDGNIDNVVVAKEFRGRGIGQMLLRELILIGNQAGMKNYTLEVRTSNGAAIHLYEKFGFVSEGVRPGFYEKPTEDALIMWKRQVQR